MVRPGVYVSESPLQRVINTVSPTNSYGAFIGTALRGPTQPTLVRGWSDFIAQFGGFANGATLPDALYQFFANSGAEAFVSRVISSTADAATATFQDATPVDRITVTASNAGLWGNKVSFNVYAVNEDTDTFALEIAEDVRGSRVVQERFTGLSMNTTAPRYVEAVVNSPTIGSRFVTVEDVAKDDAALVAADATTAPVYLANGTDGGTVQDADYTAAVQGFESVDALLLVNCPGVSELGGILAALEAGRPGDFVLIADTAQDATPDSVSNLASSYSAVYYPWVYISDPSPDAPRGGVKAVPPGASVVGMILRTDASRGVFKAPAGLGAFLSGTVGSTKRLTNAELDTLAERNVNVIRPVPGAGMVAMGARTGSSDAAQYLSVRRTINWVKKRAVQSSRFALFEPNTQALWEQLRVANGSFLSELWQAGGLSGGSPQEGYYVKCDADINSPITIANGEVHVEIGIAPVYPAEFIIIRVGQFESDTSIVVTEEV